MIREVFIFGAAGLGIEVAFTAALDFIQTRKDKHLMGYSSIWYWPLYASAPLILDKIGPFLFPLPLLVRGLCYTICFMIMEYCGMGILRLLLGQSPSEKSYYRSRWNIHGLTRLDFAPAYCLLGFIFEWLYRGMRPV